MRRIDLTLLPILCCVFVYCYPVQSKEAASTTAGRLFYLATPSLGLPSLDKETKVIVSFLTPEDGVMISITKQGVDLKQQITLTAMTDYLYNVDTEYIERDGEVTYEWALRLFSDNGYFCVTVSISFNRESTDTVQLLPVAGWGRQYYTVHLRDTFSIQIVVDKGPVNLTVTFRFTSMETSLRYKDIYIYNGDEKQFLVQAQGALEISTCRRSFGKSEDATGTRIVGTANFGVLSFSCHGVTNSSSCSRSDYVIRGLVAEMLLPQECYGTEFIVVPGVLQLEQGFIIVIASEANTDVKLIYSKEELVMLSRAGMSITIDLLQEVYLLRSSLPVQVVYIQRSTCSDKSEGSNVGPSMGLLIPTNLFYWLYLFSVPSAFNVSNFLVVVVELPSLHFIQLDNQIFSNDFSLKRAPNNSIWHIGYMSIDSGAHKLVSTQPSPFGSYLYSTSYLHPVGYIAAHVNTECEATIMTMTISDKKDNDCDRFVDEEVMNEKGK
ncbi:IgGFc-binding protein [Biomphalaria glabrata]|nr:IgGFc-binding protein [Biomphalaria glabrata]